MSGNQDPSPVQGLIRHRFADLGEVRLHLVEARPPVHRVEQSSVGAESKHPE